MLNAMLLALTLPEVGCGYFSSGKWEDDPANWTRAWGYSKPDDIVMVHSWYRRSPHWTREEAYFFQFEHHEELFKQLVTNNKMSRRESAKGPEIEYCFDRPDWFAPKGIRA